MEYLTSPTGNTIPMNSILCINGEHEKICIYVIANNEIGLMTYKGKSEFLTQLDLETLQETFMSYLMRKGIPDA